MSDDDPDVDDVAPADGAGEAPPDAGLPSMPALDSIPTEEVAVVRTEVEIDAEFMGEEGGQVTGQSRMEVAYGSSDGDEDTSFAQVGTQAQAAGTIFEQVYQPWNGTLNPRWARNWAMLRHHLYGIFAKGHRPWGWMTRLVLFSVFLLSFGDLFLLMIGALTPVNEFTQFFGYSRANMYRHVLGYIPCNAVLFPLVGAMLLGGMISDDRENGTSALYFSRPVNRRDYIAVKYITVATVLSLIILLSLTVFYLGAIVAGGEGWAFLLETLPVFAGTACAAALLIATYTSIGLALSAVSRGRFFPAVAFLGILIGTRGVAFLIEQLFEITLLYLLSPYDVTAHVGQAILGLEQRYDHPWAWSLIMLVLMNVVALYLLSVRVSSMEVTRE